MRSKGVLQLRIEIEKQIRLLRIGMQFHIQVQSGSLTEFRIHEIRHHYVCSSGAGARSWDGRKVGGADAKPVRADPDADSLGADRRKSESARQYL